MTTENNQETEIKITGKIYNLSERLLVFSRRIMSISKELSRMTDYDGPRRQLINAATSIGANFEEADGALTKKDFINKLSISRKEAKETRYWLKVINGTCSNDMDLTSEIQEIEEIISILSAILLKSGAQKCR